MLFPLVTMLREHPRETYQAWLAVQPALVKVTEVLYVVNSIVTLVLPNTLRISQALLGN
jgi:hypothetical protein